MGPVRFKKKFIHALKEEDEKMLSLTSVALKDSGTERVARRIEELRLQQIELKLRNQELMLAQSHLAEVKNKYDDLYDSAPLAYLTVDKKGLICDINLKMVNLLGVRKKEAIGSEFSRFLAPQSRAAYDSHRKQFFVKPTRRECELELAQRSGARRWVLAEFVSGAGGRKQDCGRCRLILADITRRIDTERELKDTVRRWHETFDAIKDAVCVLDPRMRIEMANRAMLRLIGKNHAEVVGRRCHEWVHGTKPAPANCPFTRVLKTRKRETEFLFYGGRWLEITVDPFLDPAGRLLGAVHTISDLTALKKSQEVLRQSEEKYHLIFNKVPCTIAGIDKDGLVVDCNARIKDMLGYEPREVLGQPMSKIFHPESLAKAGENLARVHAGALTHKQEYKMVRKDGAVIDVLISSSLLITEEGQSGRTLSLVEDVTELRWNAEKIRQSEQKFRELFDNMSSGVVVYEAVDGGKDFILREINSAVERIEKISKGKAVGRRVTAVFPGVRKFGFLDVLRRVWETGNPEEFPVGLYQDDRITGWRENYVYKLPSGEVVALYDDATERKLAEQALQVSEQRYKLLAERLDAVVFRGHAETHEPVYINAAVEKIYGYSRNEWLTRPELWKTVLYPEDRDRVLSEIQKGFQNHRGDAIEYRIVRKDGAIRWIKSHYTFEENARGEVVAIDGLVYDITDHKEAEIELQKKNIALKEILGQLEIEKENLKKQIAANVENLIFPVLNKMKQKERGASEKWAHLLETNLRDLTGTFGIRISDKVQHLSPKEIEVCNLIRNRLSNKEIAHVLHVSQLTVQTHRNNIRKKLGITRRGINLLTCLNNL